MPISRPCNPFDLPEDTVQVSSFFVVSCRTISDESCKKNPPSFESGFCLERITGLRTPLCALRRATSCLRQLAGRFSPIDLSKAKDRQTMFDGLLLWSGLRGSNPPPSPWQGDALPNELNPQIRDESRCRNRLWCLRSESNQRHGDFQSPALPTELQRQTVKTDGQVLLRKEVATRRGLEPLTSSVTG